jgi:SAM-dependent methyltransferase
MLEDLEPRNIQGIKCYAPNLAQDGKNYPLEAYERLVEFEDKHFWFRSRNRILIRIFRKYLRTPDRPRILEIGCGTGCVLSGLKLENLYELSGAELLLNGLVVAKRHLPDIEFVQLDARNLPYVGEFEAIGAFDVLEHIEEDCEVIRSVYRALAPGGLFVITVPQHQWLWSQVDDYARHKRRYSRKELVSKLRDEGFAVEYCSSFVFFLLPLMLLSRLSKRTRPNNELSPQSDALDNELSLSRPLNALLEAIMKIDELFVSAGISLPVGGSLLIVAKRREP